MPRTFHHYPGIIKKLYGMIVRFFSDNRMLYARIDVFWWYFYLFWQVKYAIMIDDKYGMMEG